MMMMKVATVLGTHTKLPWPLSYYILSDPGLAHHAVKMAANCIPCFLFLPLSHSLAYIAYLRCGATTIYNRHSRRCPSSSSLHCWTRRGTTSLANWHGYKLEMLKEGNGRSARARAKATTATCNVVRSTRRVIVVDTREKPRGTVPRAISRAHALTKRP